MKQCDTVVKDTLILPWFQNISLKRLEIQFLLITPKFPCEMRAIKTFVLRGCQRRIEGESFPLKGWLKLVLSASVHFSDFVSNCVIYQERYRQIFNLHIFVRNWSKLVIRHCECYFQCDGVNRNWGNVYQCCICIAFFCQSSLRATFTNLSCCNAIAGKVLL